MTVFDYMADRLLEISQTLYVMVFLMVLLLIFVVVFLAMQIRSARSGLDRLFEVPEELEITAMAPVSRELTQEDVDKFASMVGSGTVSGLREDSVHSEERDEGPP